MKIISSIPLYKRCGMLHQGHFIKSEIHFDHGLVVTKEHFEAVRFVNYYSASRTRINVTIYFIEAHLCMHWLR